MFLSAGGLGCALWRKCMFDKLPTGISYGAGGREFAADEPTIDMRCL